MPLKRKRPDHPSSDGGRASPHRPEDIDMAHRDEGYLRGGGGGGGGGGGRGRGYRGGYNNRRDSHPGYGRGGSGHHHGQQHQQTPQNQFQSRQQQSPSTRGASFAVPPQPSLARQAKPPTSPAPAAPKQPASSPAPAKQQTADVEQHQQKQKQSSSERTQYVYDILSDDRLRTWSDRGRNDVVQHGVQSREDVDVTELSNLYQEFIYAVADGRLEATDAGACIKEILGDPPSEADTSTFLDSLSVMVDHDIQLFRPAVRDFLIATGVSSALMREVFDAQLLQQLGLIRDTFARLGVRQATNLLYRQANYNLLREESEGYSKLITEIFCTNTVPPQPPGKTFEKVKALIGTFDLDVGRVLDVTLDVAATVLIKQFKFFVKFLRTSSWWPTSHLDDASPYVGGLPTWANPGYGSWNTTEEDEALNQSRRLARDVAFWERARELHLGAFFELGGRRVADPGVLQKRIPDADDAEDDAVAGSVQEWIKQTKTLPAPGNRVAAQLLGFKLRFYNSETRNKSDVLPANLLYLASLLIKIGFISLTDLWPHLSPADDDMDRVRQQETEKLEKKEQAARGGQMNALLMAGVLPQGDDDNPSVPAKKELPKKPLAEQKKADAQADAKSTLPEPLEQKVSLLIQLLTIGAVPESLYILGRFPWIPELFPEVRQRIHRIIHVSIDKIYKSTRPPSVRPLNFRAKSLPDVDQAGVPKGHVRLSPQPLKKTWRWPYPDACDTNENQSYRFYLDEWDDNVPICQTVDDVFTLCNTLANLSGVYIGKDEALLCKLARIGAQSLDGDDSQANYARWQDLLRRLLLPALSQTKANASAASAVWELVKKFPLKVRYNMYAEWFEGQTSRLPSMKAAFARAMSETRATMKRVSLTNVGEMAKRLAKTSYSSPGIVFKVAFEQLEVYSNLIEAFVECAKYFTELSYDVLVWSLLSSLGRSRSRTQADHALTTSKWLQALSRFSGKVFRRYPGLDPVPVLEYVDEQLLQGNATDLIILKEFVTTMGGIVDAIDFTDYQIFSLAGGSWLRRHTLIRAQDKRLENSKGSRRLIQALVDSGLAARLLIDIAQYRRSAVYQVSENQAHIKFLSSTIDDSHQTLIQYLDLLWSNLDPSSFDEIVPSIPELMTSFGLGTGIAFLIGRASLAHRMFPWRDSKPKKEALQQPRKLGTDKDGDVKMSDAKAANAEPAEAAAAAAAAAPPDGTEPEGQQVRFPGSKLVSKAPRTYKKTHQQKPDDSSLSRTAMTALQPIIDSVQGKFGPKVWRRITPELYATFWSLQLGDLCFPEEIYVKERQKIMNDWQTLASDRADMSRRAVDRKMEKRKELMDTQGFLLDELSEHGLRKAKWKFYLSRMFQTASFTNPTSKPERICDVLLEHCFLPRVLLSAADAEFSFRFIKALHDWNAPAFKLMTLYDRLFNASRLRVLIYSCTVREAEHLGRFLKLILEDLWRWHKNEPANDKEVKSANNKEAARQVGVYDREAKGTNDQPRSGFALSFNDQGKPDSFVEHAQFRDVLFRWHKNLNTALKTCLGGSEWMHIRNAITVLNSVLDFFPAIDFMAAQFTAQLQGIAKREAATAASSGGEEGGRVDLAVAAQGAMSELQKRKPKWVMVQAFRSNSAGGQKPEPPEKPSPSNKPSLRPTAPDFRPQPPKYVYPRSRRPPRRRPRRPSPRQYNRKHPYRFNHADASFFYRPQAVKASSTEAEDGEVRDAKDSKRPPVDSSKRPAGTGTPKENHPSRLPEPKRDSLKHEEAHSQPPTTRAGGGQPNVAEPRPHKLPDRPPGHNLPSRPDVPIPRHLAPERYAQARPGAERRDGREPQAARDGRGEWDGRENRENREPERAVGRPNEPSDRRAGDMAGDGGLPPRPGQHERERERPLRDPRAVGRTMPSRHNHGDSPSLPPGPSPSQQNEGGFSAERPSPFHTHDAPHDRSLRGQETENRLSWAQRHAASNAMDVDSSGGGERAVVAEDRMDGAHAPAANRTWREEGHDRGHRAPSPRRSGRYGGGQPEASSFDDRPTRPYLQDQRGPGRDARDNSGGNSNNGGGGGGGGNGNGNGSSFRDRGDFERVGDKPSGFHRNMGRSQENEHRAPHQEQNYGRLNPVASTSDVPSGPRGRGRGGMMRGNYGGHPTTSTGGGGRFGAPDTPRAPSPERMPPTGPAFGRGRRSGYEPGGSSGPATPSDRTRGFGNGPATEAQTPASMTPTSVHPDRLAQMGSSLPPAPVAAPAAHRYASNASSGARQGPTQAGGMGARQQPSEAGVPTGPASANDRLRNGGGRRQLTSINSTLQSSQSMPDLNRRAMQPRQYLGNSDAQVLTGGSPASTPGQERTTDVTWHDSAPGWGGPMNGSDGGARREREARGGHTSRRNSRERERSPRGGREPDLVDYRDRGIIKDHDGRRMGRNMAGPPPPHPAPANSGRELMGVRHRAEGGAGPREDWGGSGGAGYNNNRMGRGGPRDMGMRPPPDDRIRDERGRKRRSEEGMGQLTSERDKRPRRN
ncbi:hypothetical protein CP532_2752 [Ophiocordyceps camponoti-leonardi (nom. inval.)]|nr:hypothetical protein CP532_2752 [Ophiocordyceps camponoti-leonardi (nom. inval.)]